MIDDLLISMRIAVFPPKEICPDKVPLAIHNGRLNLN